MKILMLLFLVTNVFGLQRTNADDFSADCKVHSLKPDREADENDVREAVFRYQFKTLASGKRIFRVYFLSFGDKEEPSNKFMKRFRGNKSKVKKISESVRDFDDVKDRKSGIQGIIFNVTTIKWKNDNEVEVSGGYYEDGLSSSGNTYLVVRENNKWTVKKDILEWIV